MNSVLKKVFAWMFLGLLITFATGMFVTTNENMLANIFSSGIYLVLAIIEIVLVIVLSARISKLNPTTARILFILYSFVTGLTFSSIFIAYKLSSIIFIFLVTAAAFGVLSLIGYTTKVDLTKFGTYLFIMLIGIIICSIVNIFVGGSVLTLIVCILSIVVFMGFTIYDIQKIKQLSDILPEDNLAIYGALQLYLDFINIFIDLLRIFGKGND